MNLRSASPSSERIASRRIAWHRVVERRLDGVTLARRDTHPVAASDSGATHRRRACAQRAIVRGECRRELADSVCARLAPRLAASSAVLVPTSGLVLAEEVSALEFFDRRFCKPPLQSRNRPNSDVMTHGTRPLPLVRGGRGSVLWVWACLCLRCGAHKVCSVVRAWRAWRACVACCARQ